MMFCGMETSENVVDKFKEDIVYVLLEDDVTCSCNVDCSECGCSLDIG